MSKTSAPLPTVSRRAALTRLGLATLALGAPVTSVASVPRRQRPVPQSDDATLERLLRLTRVPSMSMAQVDGDRITTRSLGVRRAGETERATPDTVYAAASITKTVCSYVYLSLVHEGLLSLDKPVRDYVPLPAPDDPRAGAITARHLLSHSGGWINWRNNSSQALTADFDPGTRWQYSGEGFFFLQRVAEALTGKGIGTLARERVFAPLGMTRSSLAPLTELEPFQAAGHNVRGDPMQPFGPRTLLELRRLMAERGLPADAAKVEDSERALKTAEPSLPLLPNFGLTPNAAASMLTTASDFGLFLCHLVTARRHGGAPAAIVDLMMSPQIRCNEAVQWGLGVGLEDIGARRIAWQTGDKPGFKNFFFADPVREKGMVIFTNGEYGARVYERAIRAITMEDHPAFLWM